MKGFKKGKYKFRGNRQRTDANGKKVSCDGKIRWWSKQRAQEHADEINENRLHGNRKTRAYRCAFSTKDSPHWHVGREPGK